MKDLPASLTAHLASRATTLATCWIVTRADAVKIGFTDHDRPLIVKSVTCHPENGLSATSMRDGPDLASGGGEVAGSLSSPDLTEDDLETGLWDNAQVEVYLVNWQAPQDHLLQRKAYIGEITRSGGAFQAELRGLAHLLEARSGRVFSRNCDADLGDARCGVSLEGGAFQGEGLVTDAGLNWVRAGGLSQFAAGWFTHGRLKVADGPLSGFATEIAGHSLEAQTAYLALFQPLPRPLAEGTRIMLRAGCDKHLSTCRSKFSNHLNFQGFPHMPGTDFVLSYPNSNTGQNDGSVRVS